MPNHVDITIDRDLDWYDGPTIALFTSASQKYVATCLAFQPTELHRVYGAIPISDEEAQHLCGLGMDALVSRLDHLFRAADSMLLMSCSVLEDGSYPRLSTAPAGHRGRISFDLDEGTKQDIVDYWTDVLARVGGG